MSSPILSFILLVAVVGCTRALVRQGTRQLSARNRPRAAAFFAAAFLLAAAFVALALYTAKNPHP